MCVPFLRFVLRNTNSSCSLLSKIDANNRLHGCNVLYWLVKPWANKDRVVVADSYFASVSACVRLFEIGLRFIGVVKTATRQFPMNYLGSLPLPGGKGSRKGLLTTDEATGCQLMSFVWVDRDRRYFISSASSLCEGQSVARNRWTQRDKGYNAEPEVMDKRVAVPVAAETYYKGCAKIDQHNRRRQDDLQLERKVQTNDWAKRVNMSILGMVVVDAYNLCRGCTGGQFPFSEQKWFYEKLAQELIENDNDFISLRSSKRS
jgi:hypothetical protein